jgi:hypothetical protein
MYEVLSLIGYGLLLLWGAWLLADFAIEWLRERIKHD